MRFCMTVSTVNIIFFVKIIMQKHMCQTNLMHFQDEMVYLLFVQKKTPMKKRFKVICKTV